MKTKGSQKDVGESSQTLLNSLSKHGTENQGSEHISLPNITSRRQNVELSVTESENTEPKKKDLQRIITLMDGFKSSKVLILTVAYDLN